MYNSDVRVITRLFPLTNYLTKLKAHSLKLNWIYILTGLCVIKQLKNNANIVKYQNNYKRIHTTKTSNHFSIHSHVALCPSEEP